MTTDKPQPVRKAVFERAITRVEQAPETRPAVVFAGRSNVGKSSLINRLVGRKGLARTSSTPGRTQEIIYFNIEDTAWFIDLPGYGYARAPLAVQRRWKPMMERFLAGVEGIRLVVLLIDVRRDPGEEELQLRSALEQLGITYIYAATKIDKLGKNDLKKRLAALPRALGLESADAVVPVSTLSGAGIDDLLGVIREVLRVTGDEA